MTALRFPLVSRVAALCLLAGLPLLFWAAIVRPALSLWSDMEGTHADLTARLSKLTLLSEQRSGIEALIRRREAALSDPGLLWSGGSGPAIAAIIQTRLQEMVAASGGGLRSTTDLPASAEHDLSPIALRVEANGTIQTLQAMLRAIETASPALFINAVTINATPTNQADQPPALSVQLDITGYTRSH